MRDKQVLQQIFAERKPEVVFHDAALEHLPMLQQGPNEARKANILGTLNVANDVRSVGVTTFVNISTDKAINPTGVLGHSKHVVEKIASWAAEDAGFRYLSVRFGSCDRDPQFDAPDFPISDRVRGTVDCDHPDVPRNFMTIPEACPLVVQAGGIVRAGEVLILEIGEQIRIRDVSRRMTVTHGKDIEIVLTGVRENKKFREEFVEIKDNL